MNEVKENILESTEQTRFKNKLKNNEYISNYLYEIIKLENRELIPKDFDLEEYNQKYIEKEYQKNKEYFENMYKDIDPNIKLDKEQIKAILSDEDYSLIIAGAGTGKTTTMVSKVKFLVDIKKINPEKIVVISYTKKATEELEKRIILDFGINANVTTFHSLGLMHIREIFKNRKCYVVDENMRYEIFLDYFKNKIFPYKQKIKEVLEIFSENSINKGWMFGEYFKENYDKYNSFDEYFENYKRNRLKDIENLNLWIKEKIEKDINSEAIRTIKGEFVKSKGEAIIANFLYVYGIEYRYEKIYDKLMPENKTYKPDFTLNLNGENVYLEYFGLSTYEENELKRYNKIKEIKESYHLKNHNKFIKIDYSPNENIIEKLKNELIRFGFKLNRISNVEIFNTILNNNKLSQLFRYKDFIYKIIDTIKSSSKRNNIKEEVERYLSKQNNLEKEKCLIQYKYIVDFYNYYQEKLYDSEMYGFDFSDMIYYANKYIDKVENNNLNFDYIIIDEYQDISEERYLLTKNVARRNSAKIVAVGDDWQSIFAFAGSKIEYIYNFLRYFKGAKLLKITNTYRNSKQLIDYSGTFIMKNKDQIKKELVSNKELSEPINFIPFEEGNEYQTLKKLILEIHRNNKEHNIMILGRTNKIIEECYNDKELIDEVGTKIKYLGYEDIKIDGMTFHKSKGLTADEVILIGLDSNFPSDKFGYFWLEYIFKQRESIESIPFAEERRLFYVALTRTKNHVYLLVNKDKTNRSIFINEIYGIIKDKNNYSEEA